MDGEAMDPEMARRHYKRALGCGYITAIAACGMVLMAVNSTLGDLAIACGTTSTKVGTVFIAKGTGTGVGAVISPKIYRSVRGNTALSVGLLLLAATLLSMPFISTVVSLHVAYFMLGVLIDMVITGCQVMTRKVHGEKSGIWIGSNMVALRTSSALVSLICFVDDSLLQQYIIFSATSLSAAAFLGVALPAPEGFEGLLEATPKQLKGSAAAAEESTENNTWMGRKCWLFFQKYSAEFHISCMLFWLSGGKAAASAYLSTYVEYTGVIADSQKSLLMLDMWTVTAVGIVAGWLDQQYCTLPSLYRHATVAFLGGGAAGAAILMFEDSAVVLWICIGLYGLSCGPTIGYCYELNNRVNVPSETGMSVVTFGLSFGSIAVPYATSLVLDYTDSATLFVVIIVLSKLVPYPLMLNARRLAESKKRRRKGVVRGGLYSSAAPHSDATEETRLLNRDGV